MPRVHSGDFILLEPVTAESAKELRRGDIVFCRIEQTGLYYTHRIVEHEVGRRPNKPDLDVFTMGNFWGTKTNGQCTADKVYGRLIEVVGWKDPTAASAPTAHTHEAGDWAEHGWQFVA